MNLANRFLKGFGAPLEGLQLIFSNKSLLLYSIIPFVIGLVFVFFGFFAASQYLEPWFDSWVKGSLQPESWPTLGSVISALMAIVYWILLSLMNFLLGYLCIIVFAGPFYSLMVERIFKQLRPGYKIKGSLRMMVTMFFMALLKVVLFLVIGLICFVIAFIPGLNLLSGFLVVLLVAFDCSDYAFEIDYLSLRRRFAFVFNHLPEYSGIAVAILVTGFVPGAFFILLPAFICGATKMYIQLAGEPV